MGRTKQENFGGGAHPCFLFWWSTKLGGWGYSSSSTGGRGPYNLAGSVQLQKNLNLSFLGTIASYSLPHSGQVLVSPVINGVGLVTNHERVDVCRAIEHGLTLLGHVASPTTYQLRPLNLDSSSAHQDLKLAAQRWVAPPGCAGFPRA